MKRKHIWGIFGGAIGAVLLILGITHKPITSPQVQINPAINIIRYGVNANIEFIPYSFDNLLFDSAIKSLNLDVIRVPSGRMNIYNWRTDTPRINDLKILYNYTHADLIIGLNMVTQSLADQLQFLDSLSYIGVPVHYVEGGNEFNNLSNIGREKYPNGTAYGAACKIWSDSIKAHFPTVIIAVIGGNKNYNENKNWNTDILAQCNVDAFTFHCYIEPDSFFVNNKVDTNKIKEQVLLQWNESGLEATKKPIYITECNYKYSDKTGNNTLSDSDKEAATFYILKYLSQLPLIKIICLNGLTGKQGFFDVNKKEIIPQATYRAFINFRK